MKFVLLKSPSLVRDMPRNSPCVNVALVFLKQVSKDTKAITIIRVEALFAYGCMILANI